MPILRKAIVTDDSAAEPPFCSFCGKGPDAVAGLIEGADVCICSDCVEKSHELLAEDADAVPIAEGDDESDIDAAERPTFFRLITGEQVQRLLSLDELNDLMADALRRFSAGEVVQPVRTLVPVGERGELFGLMPAAIPSLPAIGAKLLTVFPQNAPAGLPTHLATVLLFSPKTGALVAVVDGRFITDARTAAVSAVSADLLARSESDVLAIIGSGAQARSHLEALNRLFEFSQIRIWSPTPEHQSRFLDEMKNITQSRLVGCDSAAGAIRSADIVVLATSASEPVVQNEWVKAGAHVISVGACRPDQCEMDPALVRRSRLFVDSRAAAIVESGDVVLGGFASQIAGELGELVAGKVEGRRSPREVTIFKSLGLAVEDVVAAELIYRRAVEHGVGTEHEL
jgi:ornithine cyclodeaminase/alanine dehydrogenase-like protein (mu-crystallin family)